MKLLNAGLRAALFCGVSASAIMFCDVGYAQSNTPSADTGTLETVVITGSRIKQQADVVSPSPLQVVGMEQIKSTGTLNIQEALQLNPSLGLPVAARTTSNYSSTDAGLSTLNLRNLGPDRTLVLIDGRRVVAGKPGTAQVDVSMIPSPFVDHVEVLTGGASAVYGSDAVAGVVNFIYKKHFEGVAINAQAGISGHGDDKQWTLNLTAGSDFANGRGNAMVFAGWTNQGAVFSKDRDDTKQDVTSLGLSELKSGANDANLQAAKDIFTKLPMNSSVIPGGVFTSGGQSWVVNADGTARLKTSADSFNRSPYKAIASPVNTLVFASRVTYDFGERLNMYMEGTYANTRSTTYMEPSPLLSSGSLGVFRGNNGYYNVEGYAFNPSTGQSVLTRNPLVPTAIFNAATDHTGDSLRDISFSLRMAEFPPGQRLAPVDRDNFRFVLGGQGSLFKDWTYDVYYEYGLTKASQQMLGLVNEDRVAEALDVVQDVFDLNHNGSTTDAICSSADARGRGCVPLNIYGSGHMSTAALNYVSASLQRDARQTQQVASANITGSVVDLPAGPMQLAAGVEYRDESSSETFDPLSQQARNSYVQLTNTKGSFDVKEAYAEVNVPVLADMPLVHALTVRGAGRISDYSTVGSFWAYNAGIEYSPVSDIRFRGVYAHAVRAPNIGELYAAANAGVASISDPCAGVTLTSTGTVSTVCRSNPSVLANINSHGGVFTLNQSDQQGAGTYQASNPNIKEESGTTWTAGVVITPTSIDALRDVTLTVDYYRIKLSDAIQRVTTDTILRKCYSQNMPEFCSLVSRRTTDTAPYSVGSVEQIVQALVNSGGTWTEGVDFTLAYAHALDLWGVSGVAHGSVTWTYLADQGNIPLTGDVTNVLAGEINYPKNKGFINLGYDAGPFGMTISLQYVGASFLDDQMRNRFVLGNGKVAPKSLFEVDPVVYTDLQLHYDVTDQAEIYFGVKNLFDEDPAPIITDLTGNVTGTLTAAGTYDAIGRRFYTGVRIHI